MQGISAVNFAKIDWIVFAITCLETLIRQETDRHTDVTWYIIGHRCMAGI